MPQRILLLRVPTDQQIFQPSFAILSITSYY